eukprot:3066063-Rhodomonas_salina.2
MGVPHTIRFLRHTPSQYGTAYAMGYRIRFFVPPSAERVPENDDTPGRTIAYGQRTVVAA